MNAIHPSNANATIQESASITISAERKLKSWELRDFVTEYQTYTSPGAAAVASRLAARYNSGKGYSYETQRQIADATGYTRNSIAQYLGEIESTGLWTIVHGKPGTASRYAPVAPELRKANMFIEYRLAGRLSSFPYPKVPNFIRPAKNAGKLKGIAKVTNAAKMARDIHKAAVLEPVATAVLATSNTPSPEYKYEISAYTPDDMDEFVVGDEPDDYFDAAFDTHDPYTPVPQVETTGHIASLTTTRPVLVIAEGCPF